MQNLSDKEINNMLAEARAQGMEQMKKKMMKNALDGEIIDLCDHEIIVKEFLDLLIDLPKKKFKVGDKVKVIIIKANKK